MTSVWRQRLRRIGRPVQRGEQGQPISDQRGRLQRHLQGLVERGDGGSIGMGFAQRLGGSDA